MIVNRCVTIINAAVWIYCSFHFLIIYVCFPFLHFPLCYFSNLYNPDKQNPIRKRERDDYIWGLV